MHKYANLAMKYMWHLRCVSTITFLQQTWWQTPSQSCFSEFVANQFGLQQTSDWQPRQKCVTFVCEATLWASLSLSLLEKCDGGNAPLDMFVTSKFFKLIGPSNDGRRHGRGTYLLCPCYSKRVDPFRGFFLGNLEDIREEVFETKPTPSIGHQIMGLSYRHCLRTAR
jgi:hypothetical protein